MSRLQQIQVTAQQTAEAISAVLGMDVTVVDENMVRIAGTGVHKNTIGQSISGYALYRKVIETGREFSITDVRQNEECGNCDQRETCPELAQLCCPVVLGKEVIGVIGLVAFLPEQQVKIQKNSTQLLGFMRKMAELTAAKAAEKDTLDRLVLLKNQVETVLHFIAEGIVAIDGHARIININDTAQKLLKVKGHDVIGFHIDEVFPGTPIAEVLRSGKGFIGREVNVWHRGVEHHYLINAKPIIANYTVQGVVASFHLPQALPAGDYRQTKCSSLDDIVGSSKALAAVKEEARKAALSHATVLITGESGTGKEMFAAGIHTAGERCDKPFVTVNCAAIPDALLESELFGYEEGSFTGAKKGGKLGKFQLAHGGTLFLDEIGDMPLALQAKMLRVLQDRMIERVGGIQPLSVDVRIIAATNRHLETLVASQLFRQDLYYRLNVFPLQLPPLRQRQEDIAELTEYFVHKHRQVHGKEILGFTPAAISILQNYPWPGNVRELENAVEYAMIRTAGGWLEPQDLPAYLTYGVKQQVRENNQKELIIKALQQYGSTVEGKQKAAAALGIGIATLYRRMRAYGIS